MSGFLKTIFLVVLPADLVLLAKLFTTNMCKLLFTIAFIKQKYLKTPASLDLQFKSFTKRICNPLFTMPITKQMKLMFFALQMRILI
jgi:hypothetical protein